MENVVDGDPPSSQSSERRADRRRYLGWLSLRGRRFVDELFFNNRLVLVDSTKQAM